MTLNLLLEHAAKVMAALGTGHRESIYAKAMNVSLNKARVFHRTEVDIPIMYEHECVGHGRADLIIGDFIVEIKALRSDPSDSENQLRKYIQNLGRVENTVYHGVVLNFNQKTGLPTVPVQIVGVAPVRKRSAAAVSRAVIEPQRVIKRSRFFVRK